MSEVSSKMCFCGLKWYITGSFCYNIHTSRVALGYSRPPEEIQLNVSNLFTLSLPFSIPTSPFNLQSTFNISLFYNYVG